jgi:hypothetical protein
VSRPPSAPPDAKRCQIGCIDCLEKGGRQILRSPAAPAIWGYFSIFSRRKRPFLRPHLVLQTQNAARSAAILGCLEKWGRQVLTPSGRTRDMAYFPIFSRGSDRSRAHLLVQTQSAASSRLPETWRGQVDLGRGAPRSGLPSPGRRCRSQALIAQREWRLRRPSSSSAHRTATDLGRVEWAPLDGPQSGGARTVLIFVINPGRP